MPQCQIEPFWGCLTDLIQIKYYVMNEWNKIIFGQVEGITQVVMLVQTAKFGEEQTLYVFYFQSLAINQFNTKFSMSDQKKWCPETDQLLKYLYEDLHIFNWAVISRELQDRRQLVKDPQQCRNRYVEKFGPVVRDQWSPEQEKQLYRLHNQNGNRWAVISQNLLGRNDNCVKNHFYSKLRKSLRTLNKIAKLYLKKQTKEISDVVLYKLTEVTDQSLKTQSDVPHNIISMSFQLKNKLLEYEVDQKNIRNYLDYTFQKELLNGLNQFNKIYKKKPKKQKISALGIENIKKNRQLQKKGLNKKGKVQNNEDQSFSEQDQKQEDKQVPNDQLRSSQSIPFAGGGRKFSQMFDFSVNLLGNIQSFNALNSESQFCRAPIPKKTINFLIKAPSEQQRENYMKSTDLLSSCSIKEQKDGKNDKKEREFAHFQSTDQQNKQTNKVQDILKAQGILENGDYGMQNYFRRTNSVRSFSMCSESSNPDMFGEDIIFLGSFKELSDMDHESHLFSTQQMQ